MHIGLTHIRQLVDVIFHLGQLWSNTSQDGLLSLFAIELNPNPSCSQKINSSYFLISTINERGLSRVTRESRNFDAVVVVIRERELFALRLVLTLRRIYLALIFLG